jgi:hypothetical protein
MISVTKVIAIMISIVVLRGAESRAQPSTLDDYMICTNLLNRERANAYQKPIFTKDVAEARRRGLTVDSCRQLISGQSNPNGFSGLWVGERDSCKNGSPTGEYYIVGRWTEKKGRFAFDNPTENIEWGKGEFRVDTNTEFGCKLRQQKIVGNEASFRGVCSYETQRVSSELLLRLISSSEMEIKIVNKRHPTTDHVYRCGEAK